MAVRGTIGGEARDNVDDGIKLPQLAYVQEHTRASTDDHGKIVIAKKRYFQLIPARIATRIADASTNALALAIFIDRETDRHSAAQLIIIIDVRQGHGWANPTVIQLMPAAVRPLFWRAVKPGGWASNLTLL